MFLKTNIRHAWILNMDLLREAECAFEYKNEISNVNTRYVQVA